MFDAMNVEYEFDKDDNEYYDEFGNRRLDNLFDNILSDGLSEEMIAVNCLQLYYADKKLYMQLKDALIDYCYAEMDEHELDSVLCVGPVIKKMEEIEDSFKK